MFLQILYSEYRKKPYKFYHKIRKKLNQANINENIFSNISLHIRF